MRYLILVGAMVLALAGCDTAEERAEEHYQSALALIEKGDFARGLVELRNVFKLNQQHHEARRLFAATLRERGNDGAAFAQYRRLVEQIPDDTEALKALAELAFESGDGNEARARVDAALAVMPDDTELQAYDAMLDFHLANTGAGDPAARDDAVRRAEALLAADPKLQIARQLVIASLIERRELDEALRVIDEGLAAGDDARPLYTARLTAQQLLGDKAGVEATLKTLIELYPEEAAYEATLIRWYMAERRPDDAEAWLRNRIPEDGTDPGPRITLIRFLSSIKGEAAARAELDRILALDPRPADVAANLAALRALRAGLMFDAGETEPAMRELEALLDEAAAEDDTTPEARDRVNRFKVTLAYMRSRTGNEVGARALVEEVLADDSANAEALKLKGEWLIDDDLTDEGIAVLREALSIAPRDSKILTLLAKAYERQGNRQLVGQMLSQAVEVSNRAVDESVRYARFLMKEKEYLTAEDVLIEALRVDSTNLQLLSLLTQVHLAMQDWARSGADIARMRELARQTDDPDRRATAVALANEMQARLLSARGDTDELLGFLQGLADEAGESLAADAAVVQSLVTAGRVDEALQRARDMAEKHAGDPRARFIHASVLLVAGRDAEGEAILREVVAEAPTLRQAWTRLYQIRMRAGDIDGALAVLDAADAALPNQPSLQWARASVLERKGDVAGAIEIYEAMYEQNNASPVIANNLASLLSSTRDDAESLERAWTYARRLQDTEVPAFADTYGWIALRRGQADAALPYLERAAEGLPDDPTVLYHLGQAYAALGRAEDARSAYEQARTKIAEGQTAIPNLDTLVEEALSALEGG